MNKTIKISIPNDYASEDRMEAAIAVCYDGDAQAAADDECRDLFEALADAAKTAGLAFDSETDFGATWTGTQEQCDQARTNLPAWAGVEDVD